MADEPTLPARAVELTENYFVGSRHYAEARDPGSYMHEVEDRMVSTLARRAHQMGGQFLGWPLFSSAESSGYDGKLVTAAVLVIRRP